MTRLDLGGGTKNTVAPGHINIDICKGADIKWDLNKGLPPEIEPNSVEGIRCNQLIEHLNTIIPLMNDCYKVLEPGGLLEISTPLAGTDPFWQDPTHKKGYIRRSFDYFCDDASTADAREEYGITAKFKVIWELLEWEWNLQVKLEKPLSPTPNFEAKGGDTPSGGESGGVVRK